MNSPTERRKNDRMEKHVQTILVTGILALLTWAGSNINNNTTALSTLIEKVAGIERVINVRMDMYKDDIISVRRRLDDHGKRLDVAEQKLSRGR